MAPSTREYFARLAVMPEHEPFRQWVENERAKVRDMLETTRDDNVLKQIQGRAQMLRDVQELMVQSRDYISKQRG